MYPILYRFQLLGGPITIGTYGVLLIVSLAAGIFLTMQLAHRQGYDKSDIFNYSMLTVAGGLIGAFLCGFFVFLPERIEMGFLSFPPILVSWGGIIGGLFTIWIIKKAWKINLLNFADIGAPAFLAGIGIGRIGCHFGGCCFGLPTTSSWGITFTDPLAPATAMNHPLIPTQSISAGFLIISGLILIIFVLKRKTPGLVFINSIVLYSLFRFTIEFWRSDPRKFILGLSDGQLFSVAALAAGLWGLYFIMKNKNSLKQNIDNLHEIS